MFRQQQSIFFNVHNTGKPVPNTILQYFTCMDMLVGANVTVFASIRSRMLEMFGKEMCERRSVLLLVPIIDTVDRGSNTSYLFKSGGP